MEYNGIELDIEQIVSENESLRSQIIEANRKVFAARESAQREREIREPEFRKKEAEIKRKLADAENKLADAEKELYYAERMRHKVLSEAGKMRMAAYNDAAKWNNAISAKFDAMIKDASKTFLGRIVEKPIWERMKRRWVSKRIAKQY